MPEQVIKGQETSEAKRICGSTNKHTLVYSYTLVSKKKGNELLVYQTPWMNPQNTFNEKSLKPENT